MIIFLTGLACLIVGVVGGVFAAGLAQAASRNDAFDVADETDAWAERHTTMLRIYETNGDSHVG
ncbi:MAG: hypothetical protein WCP25_10685 [Polynucleobacter sp.]